MPVVIRCILHMRSAPLASLIIHFARKWGEEFTYNLIFYQLNVSNELFPLMFFPLNRKVTFHVFLQLSNPT